MHPGKLNKSQLANYALNMEGASYWVIDRAASFDVNFSHSFIVAGGSTHNIFNRMFTTNLFHTMWVRNGSHYNTIQNSRFDGISIKGTASDLATINVIDFGKDAIEIKGTKVINNEFINVKAMRLEPSPLGDPWNYYGERPHANFEGSIFDSNTIEFSKSGRTDCSGNYTETGRCMDSEGGVGIKGGTDNAENPVIISNNIQWGDRPSDPTIETLSGKGGFATAYMGSKNIHFLNNIMFDGTNAIAVADGGSHGWGNMDSVIENNIIIGCGNRYKGSDASSLKVFSSIGAMVKNNLIVNPIGKWARVSGNLSNNFFGNNVVINKDLEMEHLNNNEPVKGIDTNSYYQTLDEGGYTKDFSFITDKYTNNPRKIILENILK